MSCSYNGSLSVVYYRGHLPGYCEDEVLDLVQDEPMDRIITMSRYVRMYAYT